MAETKTIKRAKTAKRAGKASSTQAGEFVRGEFEHIRKGKHGARSAKQGIAIGLSKARRAGVPLKPPAKGRVSAKTVKSARLTSSKGKTRATISKTRSTARVKALKKEPRRAASHLAISRQVRSAAKKRTTASRSTTLKRAVATTKRPQRRSEAVKKAVQTRRRARRTLAK